MKQIPKIRRQELIFQFLRGKTQDSALDAVHIHRLLVQENIIVDLRTVRRDLVELSSTHGLCSVLSRPEKYYPSVDFQLKYKLELNAETLQVLILALESLGSTSHEYFASYTKKAEIALLESLNSKLVSQLIDSKKKYTFDYGGYGKPGKSDVIDFKNLMTALREDLRFECFYSSPYKSKELRLTSRNFQPLLLSLSSGEPYMIVKDLENNEIRTLKCIRISSVVLCEKLKTNLSLLKALRTKKIYGGWVKEKADYKEITICCDEVLATFFKERIMHDEQQINRIGKNRFEVKLLAPTGKEFVRLLSSFGGHIQSISPDSFYEKVIAVWDSVKKVS